MINCALRHPREGYRRLTWMMVDEDVACVSPSSTYRILDDADLSSRWMRSKRMDQPAPGGITLTEAAGSRAARIASCTLSRVLSPAARLIRQ